MGLASLLCQVDLAFGLYSATLSCVTLGNLPVFSELYFLYLSVALIIPTRSLDKQMTTYFTQ